MLRRTGMFAYRKTLAIAVALGLLCVGAGESAERHRKRANAPVSLPGILWRDPAAIGSRDLFYGPGGKQHEPPRGRFTFLKEDPEGSNPKFDVRDENGVKWKVKLGLEARPETVASRIAWAAGYFADEDYFVRDLHVEHMPGRLHRGRKLVDPDGTVHNVRLKRDSGEEKKIGTWQWRRNPFVGTRELNGLKVVMALINNWDLKDVNNAVYQRGSCLAYEVSDLGASFASAGRTWPFDKSKGNLESYRRARFIRGMTDDTVDFQTPARPKWVMFVNPKGYFMRVHLEWIGRNIPREDARWVGLILSRLSPGQIGDAFRAAGYDARDVDEFSAVLLSRIAALTDL